MNRDFSLEDYNHGGNLAFADGHAKHRAHNATRYRDYGVGGAPDASLQTWGTCDPSVVSADQNVRLDALDDGCAFRPRF